MRYWHPHSSEVRLIDDWDAFWTEGRSSLENKAVIVKIADPEFGDLTMCLCRDSQDARSIAMALNKAREYDAIIEELKRLDSDDHFSMPDRLKVALDYAMEER